MTLGVAAALATAIVYGSADFLGGIASRRASTLAVLVVSQIAGLVVLLALLPFVHSARPDLRIGALAGIAAAVGIGCLYAALAVGRMGVVSPITAVVGAAVPVAAGFLVGQRISTLAIAGSLLALVAIVVVSLGGDAGPEADGRDARRGLGLALVSGAAIGMLYVALARTTPEARLTTIGVMRVVSILAFVAFAAVRREGVAVPRAALPVTVVAGTLDMGANVGFTVATGLAPLAIAAVITSLYPAATALLAALVLRERLGRAQWVGVGCAFVGVALIASGR